MGLEFLGLRVLGSRVETSGFPVTLRHRRPSGQVMSSASSDQLQDWVFKSLGALSESPSRCPCSAFEKRGANFPAVHIRRPRN